MKKEILFIFLRYLFIMLIGLPNLYIFYEVFTLPTVYLSYSLLSPFFSNIFISGTSIFVENTEIKLIPACIAGSAYYLILMLIFSVKMPLNKRAYSILFMVAAFLLINSIRISLLSALFLENFFLFDLVHKIAWYLGSIVIVAVLWFVNIRINKIKDIPFYSDILYIKRKTYKSKY